MKREAFYNAHHQNATTRPPTPPPPPPTQVSPVTAKITIGDIPAWAPTPALGSAGVAGVAAAAQFESHFRHTDEVVVDSAADPAAAASAAELTHTLEPQLRRARRTSEGFGADSVAERVVVAYSHVSGDVKLMRASDEIRLVRFNLLGIIFNDSNDFSILFKC